MNRGYGKNDFCEIFVYAYFDTYIYINFVLFYVYDINLYLSMLQVQATDPDCGVNAMVNYTLTGGRLESEQLLVRSDTGDICVRSPLDRETAPYLELPVIATDRGLYSRLSIIRY